MRCRAWGARGDSGARFCVYRNFLRLRSSKFRRQFSSGADVAVESTPLLLHAGKAETDCTPSMQQLVCKALCARMRPLALPLLALTLLAAQWSEPLKRIASTGSIVRPADAPHRAALSSRGATVHVAAAAAAGLQRRPPDQPRALGGAAAIPAAAAARDGAAALLHFRRAARPAPRAARVAGPPHGAGAADGGRAAADGPRVSRERAARDHRRARPEAGGDEGVGDGAVVVWTRR